LTLRFDTKLLYLTYDVMFPQYLFQTTSPGYSFRATDFATRRHKMDLHLEVC